MKSTKKLICLLLSLVVIFTSLIGFSISANAYSAHFKSEAVEWAKGQKGKYLDYDGNGYWCVDLTKYYYEYLGVTPQKGDAKDYATISPPTGWTQIPYSNGFVAQPGDIAVWTYLRSDKGHVAIVTSADSTTMQIVEQNSGGPVVSRSAKYSSGTFYGVIRPDFLPINLTNYQIVELTPASIKLKYSITNPRGVSIEKRRYYYKKQSDSKWKGGTKEYSPPLKKGTNVSQRFPNLSDNTTYDFRVAVYVDGKWRLVYQTTFTTPPSTPIDGASVPSVKVKYTDDKISTASLLTVSLNGNTLTNETDYTLSPKSVKEIGKHTVTVTGVDWYKGTVKTTVTVYPKTPTIKSVSYNSTTGRIVLKWQRVANCSYQQVAISKSSNFEKSNTCIIKEKQSKQSASFYKLKFDGKETNVKKGSTYYIRMRAYKIVDGEKIYGKWGSTKKIKCV